MLLLNNSRHQIFHCHLECPGNFNRHISRWNGAPGTQIPLQGPLGIVKGDAMPAAGIPESLNVLLHELHELRGLGLRISLD